MGFVSHFIFLSLQRSHAWPVREALESYDFDKHLSKELRGNISMSRQAYLLAHSIAVDLWNIESSGMCDPRSLGSRSWRGIISDRIRTFVMRVMRVFVHLSDRKVCCLFVSREDAMHVLDGIFRRVMLRDQVAVGLWIDRLTA